jgi:hypothetical protein
MLEGDLDIKKNINDNPDGIKLADEWKKKRGENFISEIRKDINSNAQVIKNETNRVNELRSRKYSQFSAKYSVEKCGVDPQRCIHVTSNDDNPFLFERLIINNRHNNNKCDIKRVELLQTGDRKTFYVNDFNECGNVIVRVDIHTNRGSMTYKFTY